MAPFPILEGIDQETRIVNIFHRKLDFCEDRAEVKSVLGKEISRGILERLYRLVSEALHHGKEINCRRFSCGRHR